jgi:hypothetical protein
MLLYILAALGIFVFGYLVGANNPLKSVKAKIAAEAQTIAKKV